jgi:hypothetical protein
MYEANGKQYLLVTASGGGGRGRGGAPGDAASAPTGVIAYALP